MWCLRIGFCFITSALLYFLCVSALTISTGVAYGEYQNGTGERKRCRDQVAVHIWGVFDNSLDFVLGAGLGMYEVKFEAVAGKDGGSCLVLCAFGFLIRIKKKEAKLRESAATPDWQIEISKRKLIMVFMFGGGVDLFFSGFDKARQVVIGCVWYSFTRLDVFVDIKSLKPGVRGDPDSLIKQKRVYPYCISICLSQPCNDT